MLISCFSPVAIAQPTVSNVRATQRSGTKYVDITYDLAHATGLACTIKVEVSQDGGATYATVASLTGALGAGVAPGTGKAVAWNAGQDWSATQFSTVKVRVTADDGQSSGGGPAPAGMVLIPAGTFTMGDSKSEGYSDERPTHSVTLSAFYLQSTEVTYAQWKEIVDWNTSGSRGYDIAAGQRGAVGTSPYGPLTDTAANNTHPVTVVSWWDVVKWCNAKSRKEGLTPCYTTDAAYATELKSGTPSAVYCNWSANGYRLPTEAEWEYAARGGLAGKSYPWGDGVTTSQANYYSGSYRGTTPVGYYNGSQTPAGSDMKNGYGLYDMAGNVWEWAWDWYGSYSSAAQTNLRGPASGSARVVRGGSWFYYADGLRCAYRGYSIPAGRSEYVGFRPARSSVP